MVWRSYPWTKLCRSRGGLISLPKLGYHLLLENNNINNKKHKFMLINYHKKKSINKWLRWIQCFILCFPGKSTTLIRVSVTVIQTAIIWRTNKENSSRRTITTNFCFKELVKDKVKGDKRRVYVGMSLYLRIEWDRARPKEFELNWMNIGRLLVNYWLRSENSADVLFWSKSWF